MAHPHTAPHSVPDQMWTQRQGMHAAVLSPPRALLDFLLHDAAASCHTARGSTALRQHTTLTCTHYSCCSHTCQSRIGEGVCVRERENEREQLCACEREREKVQEQEARARARGRVERRESESKSESEKGRQRKGERVLVCEYTAG